MVRLALNDDLTVAKPMARGGYTWTLPSLLGDMLLLAQSRFGERDHTYTILGIEYGERDRPRVWCPGNRKDLIIQLSASAKERAERACYQLAHECIHLLSPIGCSGTNVLEEGLATWYARYYMAERIGNPHWHSTTPSYTMAQQKLERLFELDRDAIRKLRQEQPTIAHFTAELLLRHYPHLGETLAHELTVPFVYKPLSEDRVVEAPPKDTTPI